MNSGDRVRSLMMVWLFGGGLLVTVTVISDSVAIVVTALGMIGILMFLSTLLIMLVKAPQEGQIRPGMMAENRSRRDDHVRSESLDRAGHDKAKRSDMALVERLVETMSDAELAALQRRLAGSATERTGHGADDDDVVSLDDLERRERRRNG